MRKLIKSITPTQLIALGFMLVILIGSFLLSLPISAKNLKWTNYLNALFTATSATCVTGLVTYDTNTHFSIFGQISNWWNRFYDHSFHNWNLFKEKN